MPAPGADARTGAIGTAPTAGGLRILAAIVLAGSVLFLLALCHQAVALAKGTRADGDAPAGVPALAAPVGVSPAARARTPAPALVRPGLARLQAEAGRLLREAASRPGGQAADGAWETARVAAGTAAATAGAARDRSDPATSEPPAPIGPLAVQQDPFGGGPPVIAGTDPFEGNDLRIPEPGGTVPETESAAPVEAGWATPTASPSPTLVTPRASSPPKSVASASAGAAVRAEGSPGSAAWLGRLARPRTPSPTRSRPSG